MLCLSQSDVGCFCALWNEIVLPSFKVFDVSKKCIILKINIQCLYAFSGFLYFYYQKFCLFLKQIGILHWKWILIFVQTQDWRILLMCVSYYVHITPLRNKLNILYAVITAHLYSVMHICATDFRLPHFMNPLLAVLVYKRLVPCEVWVLTAMLLRIQVFWDVTFHWVSASWCFKGM